MKKIWIVIAIIIVLLGIGAYFLFSGSNNNATSNSQQYQAPTVSGNSSNSVVSQTDTMYSGLNLTPDSLQTEVVPSASSDIASP